MNREAEVNDIARCCINQSIRLLNVEEDVINTRATVEDAGQDEIDSVNDIHRVMVDLFANVDRLRTQIGTVVGQCYRIQHHIEENTVAARVRYHVALERDLRDPYVENPYLQFRGILAEAETAGEVLNPDPLMDLGILLCRESPITQTQFTAAYGVKFNFLFDRKDVPLFIAAVAKRARLYAHCALTDEAVRLFYRMIAISYNMDKRKHFEAERNAWSSYRRMLQALEVELERGEEEAKNHFTGWWSRGRRAYSWSPYRHNSGWVEEPYRDGSLEFDELRKRHAEGNVPPGREDLEGTIEQRWDALFSSDFIMS